MRGARLVGKLMLILFCGVSLAAAQTPSASDLKIWQSMKHNADALQHYVYKRGTEVTLNGEPRGKRVDLIRTVDGRKETIPLETPEHVAGARQGRGLRGKLVERKVEKKREEMKGDIERLKELTNSYLPPNQDMVGSILQKAKITRIGSAPDSDVQLSVAGLKRPSDSFTMVWSVTHCRPVSVDIRAEADGKPVQLTVQYASLADGTFYPARTVITAPKKNLVLTIVTFEYSRSAEKSPS